MNLFVCKQFGSKQNYLEKFCLPILHRVTNTVVTIFLKHEHHLFKIVQQIKFAVCIPCHAYGFIPYFLHLTVDIRDQRATLLFKKL